MTPLRRLTYRWLSLPYITRRRIAQDMRLETVGEADDLPDTQHEGQVLRRAQERTLLARLWDAVEASHNDRVPPANPFARSIGEIMDAAAKEGDTSEDCEP